jgi:hypothetical protein
VTLAAVAALAFTLLPVASASAKTAKRDVLSMIAPPELVAGQAAVLHGRLTDRASHRPIGRAAVTVYYKRPGIRSWTALKRGRTNRHGYYTATITVPSTGYLAAHFAGNGAHVAKWSRSALIAMHASAPAAAVPVSAAPTPTKSAPASTIPADGTNYWASNGCHYYVANRTWYADYCVAYQTDSAGRAITTVINVYAYNSSAPSHVGPLLYQLSTGSPEWIVWRVPSDPEFETVLWTAVPRNNIYAEPKIEIYFEGHLEWTSVAELQQLIATLQTLLALEQQQGITPAPTNLVTVGGASETSQALTDLANGVDRLGGNAQLGQAASNVFSLGISEPFTPGVCGEYGYYCYPIP